MDVNGNENTKGLSVKPEIERYNDHKESYTKDVLVSRKYRKTKYPTEVN